jgi:hypothetical protein
MVKIYVSLVLLLTSVTALAFPVPWSASWFRLIEDSELANQIALGLGLVLILQSIFSFSDFHCCRFYTENTLANVRLALYTNGKITNVVFFLKNGVGEQ